MNLYDDNNILHTAAPGSPSSAVFDLPAAPITHRTPHPFSPENLSSTSLAFVNTDDNDQSCIVISGGTGGNGICPAFSPDTCYVLPVSDDGGSSSEIIRVIGGPSVGDIRSRLIRLIPSAPPHSPQEAIRTFLSHRLPTNCTGKEARDEWREIVEGRSHLWSGIPSDRKETIRGFLVYFESEVLKRAHKNFTFVNGSIGNYLLAAAQQFFRSLPSAIFLLQSITRSEANILPVLVTNHTVTIAAQLENKRRLVGQCEISHPVTSSTLQDTPEEEKDLPVLQVHDPDAEIGTVHRPTANVKFESQTGKDGSFEALPSPISRNTNLPIPFFRSLVTKRQGLFYINAYGMEIFPTPNPDYLANLSTRKVLLYSCGSLWTSIMPCLCLRGVGPAIASSQTLRAKVLLLNSKNDRETDGYTAQDYIMAISRMLNEFAHTSYPVSAFVTDLVFLKGTSIPTDRESIAALGIRCWEIQDDDDDDTGGKGGIPKFTAKNVKEALEMILKSRSPFD